MEVTDRGADVAYRGAGAAAANSTPTAGVAAASPTPPARRRRSNRESTNFVASLSGQNSIEIPSREGLALTPFHLKIICMSTVDINLRKESYRERASPGEVRDELPRSYANMADEKAALGLSFSVNPD